MVIRYDELNSENIPLFKKIATFLNAKETYENIQCFKENSQSGTYINKIKKNSA